MDENKAIALVAALLILTLGIVIPSVRFISKSLDIQHARTTTRLCCK